VQTKLRVLVVDDDPNVRRGLRMRLGLSGIEIVGEAADGTAAVRQALALCPDVVLLDLNLPGIDGLTACRTIRAHGPAVVMLSLEDHEGSRERCRAAGAAEFVSKQDPVPVLVAALFKAAGVARGRCATGERG
jgi:DNA-binding NarL/FixJ family response regulator